MAERIKGSLYRAWTDGQLAVETLREQKNDTPPSSRVKIDTEMDFLLLESYREKEKFYVQAESGKVYKIGSLTNIPSRIFDVLREDPTLSVPVTFEITGKKKPQAVNLKF